MRSAPKVTLLLGLHNHQPDGNFDEVFATGYDDCYRRIVDALEAAPHVRAALHHTGPLLEWIERHRPDYFARVRALVGGGQVEILGGGFYEPMLAVLPERDAVGQVRMMADYCGRHLGQTPAGMWLAERVWEPGMPALLHRAGMRFTLIDDGHFRYAGVTGKLQGYYATEKAGATVAIFPIEQKLRYAIPFAEPGEVIRTLLDLADEHGRDVVLTYGDDGEKFGMWPGTKEWVWDKGWLAELFRLLGEHRERITTSHFGSVLATTPSSGRVYLPTASYEEMGEWALPAQAQRHYLHVRHDLDERGQLEEARPFLRGGIWQGFLAKYPEANFMHKKMIAVSERVAAAHAAVPERRDELEVMRRELYRAQCNCSYWHGLFGGLYLNYLRDTVFRHLLVAEAFADAALGRPAPAWAPCVTPGLPPSVELGDLDGDLAPEVVIQSHGLDVVVRPHDGGTIQELAYRPKTFALTNVLGRHEEGYHEKLRQHLAKGDHDDGAAPKSIHDLVKVKEPHLDRYLVYDRHPRYCFVDHFLPREMTLDQLAGGLERELGDFVFAPYALRPTEAPGSCLLHRRSRVGDGLVDLEKRITVDGPRLTVAYRLSLVEGALEPLRFAPELSLTLLDGSSTERVYQLPGANPPVEERLMRSRGSFGDQPGIALLNQANRFRVDLDFGGADAEIWRFPLETVSMSEAGFERTYQGSVIVPLFPLSLAPGHSREITLHVTCADLG